jgi:hypothetical protein
LTLNPAAFTARHPDVPFNFDLNSADYDAFWHDPRLPQALKGDDPCTWDEATRAEVDRQHTEWMALYHACSRGEHQHA